MTAEVEEVVVTDKGFRRAAQAVGLRIFP